MAPGEEVAPADEGGLAPRWIKIWSRSACSSRRRDLFTDLREAKYAAKHS
jgi:hypothetical protein